MIRILQINMHRSATTHELLAELKTEVVGVLARQFRTFDVGFMLWWTLPCARNGGSWLGEL